MPFDPNEQLSNVQQRKEAPSAPQNESEKRAGVNTLGKKGREIQVKLFTVAWLWLTQAARKAVKPKPSHQNNIYAFSDVY